MLELVSLFDESFFACQYSKAIIAVEKSSFGGELRLDQPPSQFAGCQPNLWDGQQRYASRKRDSGVAPEGSKFRPKPAPVIKPGQVAENSTIPQLNKGFVRHNHPEIDSLNSPDPQKILGRFQPSIHSQKSGNREAAQTVLLWDEAAQEAVRKTSPGPTIASRAYAMVHTAMFDAWASYDPVAVGTQLADRLQRPPAENTLPNKSEAISYAAYFTLIDLFPTQTPIFVRSMQRLGYDPERTGDPQTPSGIGREAAKAIVEFRHGDGSNQLNNYADPGNYRPANAPDRLEDPNRWQPLRVPLNDPNGKPQAFLTPHWGEVIPFALTAGSQFRPPAPPQFATPLYYRRVQEVLDYSAGLTDEQKIIAEYWEDGPGTSFPPGKWMSFAQYVSGRDNHSLDEDVKLFFTLANAVFDAGIAAWEAKRYYDYIRPVSAIRSLFNGRKIKAWGGPGKATQTLDGSRWHPYQRLEDPTPPFPEYVSGHSSYSAAAAEVLKRFTGSDRFGASYTAPAGSSHFEPGVTPAEEVTLSWATFSEAADEAGISRLYGGIHFRDGDLNGRILGRQVGEATWNKAQTFINGG